MPLFRRADGDLIRDESPSRTLLPYLLRGRNESVIFHEQTYDITRTRAWLRQWNRRSGQMPATLFHLFLWACGRAAQQRPKMNRFVSSGALYARRGVWLSFVVQRSVGKDSPFMPVKLGFDAGGADFAGFVERVGREVELARSDVERAVDRETRLAVRLPHVGRRLGAALYRVADAWNLLPGGLIETDPMYATVFVANLGSLGLDRTFHHLYEHGTCSLFAVMGAPARMPFVDRTGVQTIRDGLNVRWTFDERIVDAHYCAGSLDLVRRIVESPDDFIDGPEDAWE